MTPGELEAYLHTSIPVSRLMGIQVKNCRDGEVCLTAPLSTNHNHLGTAFGGSLAAIATLAGYCALWQALGNQKAHIVIRRSSIEYLRPVTGEISAICEMPVGKIVEDFRILLGKRGKARMNLEVIISENSAQCVRFSGEFVAID